MSLPLYLALAAVVALGLGLLAWLRRAPRMPIARLHPELRKGYALISAFFPISPLEIPGGVALAKFFFNHVGLPKVPATLDFSLVDGLPGGQIRVFKPKASSSKPSSQSKSNKFPALMWIRGGGYVIGNAAMYDQFCLETAEELGIVVVAAEYRNAFIAPFPGALDDLSAVWLWMIKHAEELGVDTQRLAIGGQSAGGGLAAALAQRLHDAGGLQPVAQLLFCPMIDDRTCNTPGADETGYLLWSNQSNRIGWRVYLGAEPGTTSPPEYAVPALREDLRGLPPAWVGIGDADLFYEEDVKYYERLKEAGVPCELAVVQGAPHSFEMEVFGAEVSKRHRLSARNFLQKYYAQ